MTMGTSPDPMSWLPTTSMPVRQAAELYIQHGFRVCIVHGIVDGKCTCGNTDGEHKRGKHPVSPSWQKKKYQTTDEYRDALAAKRMPTTTNLGIVMGEQLDGSHLLAVDVDDYARLAELEAILGPLPATLRSRSGGGGAHRIYVLGPGQDHTRLRNRTGVRLTTEDPTPGVDVKWIGGQVVVCPSLHESGAQYDWDERVAIAELPQAWFELIAEPAEAKSGTRPRPLPGTNVYPLTGGDKYLEAVIDNACRDISGRGKGERNSVLFAKSCTVLEHCAGAGVSFERALIRLREAGMACGLPKSEVSDTLRKAERQVRSTGNTRTHPPPTSQRRMPSPPPISTPPGDGDEGDGTDEVDTLEWANDLSRSKQGNVKATFGNVCLILRHDAAFANRFSYNRMRIMPFIDGRPLEDADVARVREEIERRWDFCPANEAVVQAILLIANERCFHPLHDYLNALTWDGTKRLERVAQEILGHKKTDEITQRMLRCWFISAVARALSPGCKVDTTLVLVGDQGHKKSTFFSTLGGEWFSDTYVDIRNKDGILQVHAAWLLEWAEIERVTVKTSSSDVKAFLTSAKDSVRPPFGRGVIIQPRSSVIVGTTNKAFLDDETGSRRFWPVSVFVLVNIKLLKEWRDQLWAEAAAAYRAGESWWLSKEDDVSREETAHEHMVENPWLERIAVFLTNDDRRRDGVTIADVITDCMRLELSRAAHSEATRVGKALSRLHWWWRWETRSGVRLRVYYPREAFVRDVDHVDPYGSTENQASDRPDQHDQPLYTCKGDLEESVSEESRERARAHDHTPVLRETADQAALVDQTAKKATRPNACQRDADQAEEGFGDWLRDQGVEPPDDDSE